MRIPENQVWEVQNLIGGGSLESVTESKHEIVTESVESVTESKAEPIEDIRRIVERWGGAAKASSGRQRPGQAVAVGKVLGDVAGSRPGHPSELGVWGATEQ
jgi:hypothetical protein